LGNPSVPAPGAWHCRHHHVRRTDEAVPRIDRADNLRKYNLTLSDVMDAIDRNNQNTGGSIIERGGQGFAVRDWGH